MSAYASNYFLLIKYIIVLLVSTRAIHLQEHILNGTLKFVDAFSVWHFYPGTIPTAATG
jgi:hypothetical protein